MKVPPILVSLALLASACGGSAEPSPTPTTNSPSQVAAGTSPPTTSRPPATTTTTIPPTTSTIAPDVGGSADVEVWDGGERGFVVNYPAGWEIIGEVDEGLKNQVIAVTGLSASRELLATPMVFAADPILNGNGLFIAPIPPSAASGAYDEYAELIALDESGLRGLEALLASTGAEQVTARLTTTAQGHVALVVATRLFDLNFEMITIAPEDGVAWTIVGSYGDELYASGAADAVLESFLVTGEPEIPEPGPSSEELVAEVAGAPEIHGSLLPQLPGDGADDAVGMTAPTVIGVDFDGLPTSIEHDGAPKAIVFMAHWCPHCQNEVPAVQAWLNATGGVEGVEIITIVTAYSPERGNWPPQGWLEGEGWTPPVIRDDAASSIYRAYGTGGFPYWVFLNGDGSVALRSAGTIDTATLQSILESLTG